MSIGPGFAQQYPGFFARAIGIGTACAGLLILTLQGLTGGSSPLTLPLDSLEGLTFLFLGAALWFQSRSSFARSDLKTVFALALPPVLLGAAVLAGVPPFAGMLGFAPAAGIVLIGLVLALPDLTPWPNSRPLQALLVVVVWASLLNLATLAYGAATPGAFSRYVSMPLPLALVFLVLVAGTLLARARVGILATLLDDHIGGAMARILLPLVLVAPFLIGWLRIYGIRNGYYDSYFGYAQFATTNVLTFSLFIWISARTLNHIDAKRHKALENVQEGNLELTRLNASLEARIRQHYVAEEARKKAEMQLFQSQKMEALGTLASGIAHDFNNILTIILLNADIAGEALPPGHPARQNLGEIGKAGGRAADLIRRIMTFGRHSDSELKTLRIEKVIDGAIDILQRSLPPGIRVESGSQGHLPPVNANHSHIEQVLVNLGANAAHAMGKEGGTLDIRLEAVEITAEKAGLSAQLREGNYVRITVSDSGHGMDAHTLKNIFNPFFTTKAPGEGTGLGLSVVHGIMKLHGGAITVYSEPGRGTVFSLYFPAAQEILTAGQAPAETLEIPRGNGEHILCVDDDESLIAAVSTLLTHFGYRTTVHGHPRAAVEDFRSRPDAFDLVLTDFSMPEMSGLAVARAVVGLRPDTPIVMMSGYLRPEDAEEAARAGIREVLLKPDVPERLAQIIHRQLASRKTALPRA